VLADRGRRELPIAADFVGEHIQLPDTQILAMEKVTDGTHELFRFVIEERA
jgi:pyrimidine operon attenuation protein/uracil phosphoribosyltransferase